MLNQQFEQSSQTNAKTWPKGWPYVIAIIATSSKHVIIDCLRHTTLASRDATAIWTRRRHLFICYLCENKYQSPRAKLTTWKASYFDRRSGIMRGLCFSEQTPAVVRSDSCPLTHARRLKHSRTVKTNRQQIKTGQRNIIACPNIINFSKLK